MHRPETTVLPAAILVSCLLAGLGFTAAQSMSFVGLSAPAAASAQASLGTQNPVSLENPDQTISTPTGLDGSTACAPGSRYPEGITRWCDLIQKSAAEHGLAVDLIAALMLEESGGDPLAYSASGAVGLLQVMPRDGLAEAFQCINGPCFAARPSISELQDPAYNLDFGTRLLRGLLASAGDLREALRAYGPVGVEYAYADDVLAILEAYRPATPERSISPSQ